MKFFSRWSRQKESLEKRAAQRQEAPTNIPPAAVLDAEKAKTQKKHGDLSSRILLKPLITEKASYLQSGGIYCFAVSPAANKIQVKKAVEDAFGVMVMKVRISNCRGKRVSYGRIAGQRRNWKRAWVALKKGEKIEIHQSV